MRHALRWPLLPIAGGSSDDDPPPALTPALAKELEELRAYRAQSEPTLTRELDELRAYRTQTEPRLAELSGQLQQLTGEHATVREQLTALTGEHADAQKQLDALAQERDQARARHLEAHRARLLAEHPDIVPKLVQSDSVDALNGSLAHAHAPHKRIAEQVAQRTRASATGTYVAAGTPPRQPPQPPTGTMCDAASGMVPQSRPRNV
ncbi:MAG TPA: hypothetical protein VII06_34540 [Chloroflexota bacterium]|jgi:chromosome segregation ATPase